MPFITNDIGDWYWSIAGDLTKVYSSARAQYVPVTDLAYIAWAASNTATSMPSSADLYEVLTRLWVQRVFNAGITITSVGTPAINGLYPLDPQSQQYISAISTGLAAGKGLPGGGNTFMYNGNAFSAGNFLAFATAAEDYAYNVVQTLGQIVLTGTGSMPSSSITIS